MTRRYDRRAVLAGSAGLLGSLAGCGGRDGDGSGADERTTATDEGAGAPGADGTVTEGGTATAAATDAGTSTGRTDGELDLREANVVGVEVSGGDSTSYRFDVTLYHDDAGEEGYANWWQVETVDGDRLGRRDLTHAHGTTRFTRSATVEVPEETTCVVVRGHDQTHGYGGRAALVDLERETPIAIEQGSEPEEFADEACP